MQLKTLLPLFLVLALLNSYTSATYYYRRGYGRYGYRRGLRRAVGGAVIGATIVGGGLLALGALALLGKKKRSVDDPLEVEEISPIEEALNRFDLANELDEDLCAAKTLCEIMATTDTKKSTNTLIKILDFIYSGDMPLLGAPGHEKATSLLEAGLLGKTAKSADVCRIAFKTCKTDFATRKQELQEGYNLVQKYGY